MNPLENLQDIQNPAEIGIWPIAYGWWLLLVITLVIAVAGIKYFLRYRHKRQAQKQALQALNDIDLKQANAINQINQLLKRVAMAYFPSISLQQLHSGQWTEFLLFTLPDSDAKKHQGVIEQMQQQLYQVNQQSAVTLEPIKHSAQVWIKKATPPSTKTINKLEQHYAGV